MMVRGHASNARRVWTHATNPVPYDQGRRAFQERFLKSWNETI